MFAGQMDQLEFYTGQLTIEQANILAVQCVEVASVSTPMLGTLPADTFKLGTIQADKVMLGANEVWSGAFKPIIVSTNPSFDVDISGWTEASAGDSTVSWVAGVEPQTGVMHWSIPEIALPFTTIMRQSLVLESGYYNIIANVADTTVYPDDSIGMTLTGWRAVLSSSVLNFILNKKTNHSKMLYLKEATTLNFDLIMEYGDRNDPSNFDLFDLYVETANPDTADLPLIFALTSISASAKAFTITLSDSVVAQYSIDGGDKITISQLSNEDILAPGSVLRVYSDDTFRVEHSMESTAEVHGNPGHMYDYLCASSYISSVSFIGDFTNSSLSGVCLGAGRDVGGVDIDFSLATNTDSGIGSIPFDNFAENATLNSFTGFNLDPSYTRYMFLTAVFNFSHLEMNFRNSIDNTFQMFGSVTGLTSASLQNLTVVSQANYMFEDSSFVCLQYLRIEAGCDTGDMFTGSAITNPTAEEQALLMAGDYTYTNGNPCP